MHIAYGSSHSPARNQQVIPYGGRPLLVHIICFAIMISSTSASQVASFRHRTLAPGCNSFPLYYILSWHFTHALSILHGMFVLSTIPASGSSPNHASSRHIDEDNRIEHIIAIPIRFVEQSRFDCIFRNMFLRSVVYSYRHFTNKTQTFGVICVFQI